MSTPEQQTCVKKSLKQPDISGCLQKFMEGFYMILDWIRTKQG